MVSGFKGGGGGNKADEGVMASGSMTPALAGKGVEGVAGEGPVWVVWWEGARGWIIRASINAVHAGDRRKKWKRQVQPVTVQELELHIIK